MKTVLVAIGVLVQGLSCASAATNQSSLTGTVRDNVNQIVPGALVRIYRVRDLTRGSLGRPVSSGAPIDLMSSTTDQGTFSFTSLPAGKYYVCVSGYFSAARYVGESREPAFQPDSAQAGSYRTKTIRRSTCRSIKRIGYICQRRSSVFCQY